MKYENIEIYNCLLNKSGEGLHLIHVDVAFINVDSGSLSFYFSGLLSPPGYYLSVKNCRNEKLMATLEDGYDSLYLPIKYLYLFVASKLMLALFVFNFF